MSDRLNILLAIVVFIEFGAAAAIILRAPVEICVVGIVPGFLGMLMLGLLILRLT